jgi:hypothetical protein
LPTGLAVSPGGRNVSKPITPTPSRTVGFVTAPTPASRRAAEARIRTPDLCLQPQRLIGTQLALNQPKLKLQLLAPGLQLQTISLG